MNFLLYNTLTKSKNIFNPINKDIVKMYVCGPTVYDTPHIGNARSMITYDLLYRILCELFGNKQVLYVRNITDIDDKIIQKASTQNISTKILTEQNIVEFQHDMKYLNCIPPNIEPKATENIDIMILLIQKLLNQDHAYLAHHHVFFDVKKFDEYTKLSGRSYDFIKRSIKSDPNEFKKNSEDFVLWKPASKNDILSFDSPWGYGRPGWHIECSAMSYKYLGENFDIHGGGIDLIFPHHTNEIAQSKSAFKGSNFANIWVHNGFLTVNGEKMSKSRGNFITIKDLKVKKISGNVIRLLLLNKHYRKPLNYNEKALYDAAKMIDNWYNIIQNSNHICYQNNPQKMEDSFLSALLNDMNTPLAIKIINDYAKLYNKSINNQTKTYCAYYLVQSAKFMGFINQ